MINDSRKLLVSVKIVFSSSLSYIGVSWKTFLSFSAVISVFLRHLQEYNELNLSCSSSLQSSSTKGNFSFFGVETFPYIIVGLA